MSAPQLPTHPIRLNLIDLGIVLTWMVVLACCIALADRVVYGAWPLP